MRRAEDPKTRPSYHPVPLDSIAPAMAEAATTGEDARFWTHDGIDYTEIRAALDYRHATFDWHSKPDRTELWREHDHAAAREESVPLTRTQPPAQGQGGGHRLPAGARARQEAHPGAVSECGGAGARRVGRGGGEPQVLRALRRAAHREPGGGPGGDSPLSPAIQPQVQAGAHAPAPGFDHQADAGRAGGGAEGGGRAGAGAGRHDSVDAGAGFPAGQHAGAGGDVGGHGSRPNLPTSTASPGSRSSRDRPSLPARRWRPARVP
jgi:hypothetical protein